MKTANFPPYAELSWQEDIQALKIKWIKQHLKLNEFEEIVKRGQDILKSNEGSIWISDMSESQGVFTKDIIEYIKDEQTFAVATSVGVKWALTVLPKAVGLSSMSTKSWNNKIKKMDSFLVEEFPDWETCREWILNQLKNQ